MTWNVVPLVILWESSREQITKDNFTWGKGTADYIVSFHTTIKAYLLEEKFIDSTYQNTVLKPLIYLIEEE